MYRYIAFALICASALFGQSDRGTITGTITDPASAVVAGANIEAKNTETGAVFRTTSTETGNYTLAQVPVGTYTMNVSVTGFKTFVRENIAVQVAQTLRLDAKLEVGQTSESVTVSGEVSLLKTETGDISHNVTVQTLNELPILGVGSAAAGSSGIRNPNNVVQLVPGTYYAPNSNVKINGAPTNSQSFRVEGMDATNQGFPYAAAQTQPSVDAIQEISVQTSNFAAEFGAAGGGFFNVTMRSGTNAFHGSVYDYFVNEALNAGTPFTDAGLTDSTKAGQHVRPRARRNDYGGTFGGPVWIPKLYNGKDKTFFFFNFEQFRETQIINNIPITVPTAAYRTGDFGGALAAAGNTPVKLANGTPTGYNANQIFDPASIHLDANGQLVADPFPNNVIPTTRLDPVALKVQSFIPAPTNSAFINNYLPSYPSTRHTTVPAVKVDQNIGNNGKLSFYWSYTHTDSQYSPTYGGSEGLPDQITATRGTFIHSHVERLNYDHTLAPTLLLHLGVGYQQNNFFDDAPITDFNAQQTFGLVGATLNRAPPVFNGFCSPVAPCTGAGGTYNMGPGAGQSHSYWEKPSANASLTWVRGNHTFKFGGDMYLQGVPTFPYTNTNGTYSFSVNETSLPYLVGVGLSGGALGFPYASFLLGAVDQYSVAAPSEYRQGKKQLAFYAQDSWKVTQKLTLDLGLRYDYGTYYKEQYGRAGNFSASTPNPSAGGHPGGFIFEGGPNSCNCDFASNYPYAFGPRVGLAYQITPKTVLRAGWGLIYNQTGTNSLGINNASIIAVNTVVSPGAGQPAMYLRNGIPSSQIPTYPNFSPGVAPILPIGNQPLPSPGVGGNSGLGLLDPEAGRPARQNQWSIGIQHEVARNLVLEAAYVANRGVWWNAPALVDVNALTPDILAHYGLSLNNPADLTLLSSTLSSATAISRGFNHVPYTGFATTNTVAQSLRPFPQFSNIPAAGDPLGKTWYDSLQTKATKRFSHGFTANAAFTWQKSLQLGVDTNPNTTAPGGAAYVNYVGVNPNLAKSLSSFDQPLTFILSAAYDLPAWGPGKVVRYLVKDWELGALLQYASGLPIPTPAATTSLSSQIFQPTLMNRVSGVDAFNVDINCHCYDPGKTFVLNPNAWVNPPAGQFGSGAAYYDDYRYQRHPQENLNFGRNFKIRERVNLNVRAEFYNIFNRTYYNNPSATNPTLPQTRNNTPGPFFGNNSGGFGYINLATTGTQFGQPRTGTIVMRLQF
jgi:outer membrane receptor protein involved in Fe transport